MAREEINEQQLEDVVGGAFHYQYDRNGNYIVLVDGLGVFNAKENAKRQINLYNAEHPGMTDVQLAQWAKSQGLFWDL